MSTGGITFAFVWISFVILQILLKKSEISQSNSVSLLLSLIESMRDKDGTDICTD